MKSERIPVLDVISTSLDLRSVSSGDQSRLGHLHRSFFLPDAHLDQFNVLLHVEDFLQNLFIKHNCSACTFGRSLAGLSNLAVNVEFVSDFTVRKSYTAV